jgi:putative protease
MELLSPAGDLQKLEYAIHYGCDAVYTAGKKFGLRANSKNLSDKDLIKAVDLCHSQNKKIFVTVNIFAHNKDLIPLKDYLRFLSKIDIDAIIVSDPAIFNIARKYFPELDIHISTQANVTSWQAAQFWHDQGAKRIILARELTISEIKEIRDHLPDLELEMFVHGAMCMSYSGRCLLSSFLNARSANQGECTQPCRWEYSLMEASRQGQYFPIVEDNSGTYILNSRDLCLISRLREIEAAGINSIKIEGRMKSLYYVANTTRIYREALMNLDRYDPTWRSELEKVSHRPYTEGFFDVFDSSETQFQQTSSYIRNHQYLGEILKVNDREILVSVKAKFKIGEEIEFIFPDRKADFFWQIENIQDEENKPLMETKPNTTIKIALPKKVLPHGILRKKIAE